MGSAAGLASGRCVEPFQLIPMNGVWSRIDHQGTTTEPQNPIKPVYQIRSMQADQTARQEKQGVENVFGEAGIKGGEGFVRQHEFRLLMQQTAQSHPLALPSGELTHGLFLSLIHI